MKSFHEQVSDINQNIYTRGKASYIDEVSSSLSYIAEGPVSGDTSQPIWQIRRVQTTSNVTSTQYADGDLKFDNIWDDRASLNYH